MHLKKYFESLFSLSNLENFGDSLFIFHYQGLGFLTGWILFQSNYLRTLNHETNYAVNSTNESNCIFSDLFGFKTVNYVTKREKQFAYFRPVKRMFLFVKQPVSAIDNTKFFSVSSAYG